MTDVFLIFGQSGVDKTRAVNNLARALREDLRCQDNDTKAVLPIFLEDEIVGLLGSHDFIVFLESYYAIRQREKWEQAARNALERIRQEQPQYVLLSVHLSFYRHSRFFTVADMALLQQFSPKSAITLIDDVFEVRQRILNRNRENPSASFFSINELLVWRSVETTLADAFCQGITPKIPHYVVAVKHPASMAVKLLRHLELPRVYASYPITSTRGDSRFITELTSALHRIDEATVLFNPATVDEMIMFETDNVAGGQAVIGSDALWPSELGESLCEGRDDVFPVSVPLSELGESVKQAVRDSIRERDFRLVESASRIAVFRPLYPGRVTRGVSAELGYAAATMHGRALAYHPVDDGDWDDSPFASQATRFADMAEWLRAICRTS